VFGQSVHALVDDSFDPDGLGQDAAWQGSRSRSRPLAASLEDVFVELTIVVRRDGGLACVIPFKHRRRHLQGSHPHPAGFDGHRLRSDDSDLADDDSRFWIDTTSVSQDVIMDDDNKKLSRELVDRLRNTDTYNVVKYVYSDREMNEAIIGGKARVGNQDSLGLL